jgi:hypothetical protein
MAAFLKSSDPKGNVVIRRIHVNQHIARANKKNGTHDPALSIKTSKSNEYAREVDILDSEGKVVATVVSRPEKPLSCGATIWIELHGDVVLRT